MVNQLSQEQFWELYQKLPQELKDSLWAQETGDAIYEICKRCQVTESLQGIVQLVQQVLVGVLLPQDFQKELEDLGMKTEVAKKIAVEVNRFIFYPIKPTLEQLHKMEIEVSAKVATPEPAAPESAEDVEEQKPAPKGDDSYREPIE